MFFAPILSGLRDFYGYSCVELQKACSERNYIYEKVNHHHPRTNYDAVHHTESGRKSTARDRRKNATDGDNGTGGASTRRK